MEGRCDFCEVEVDESWLHRISERGYGVGPASERDLELCGFCYQTQAASSWTSGGRNTQWHDTVRDVSAMLNVLREDVRKGSGYDLPPTIGASDA